MACRTDRSEWQTPLAAIFTTTSSSRGALRRIDSTVSGSLKAYITAALIISPPSLQRFEAGAAVSAVSAYDEVGVRVKLDFSCKLDIGLRAPPTRTESHQSSREGPRWHVRSITRLGPIATAVFVLGRT